MEMQELALKPQLDGLIEVRKPNFYYFQKFGQANRADINELLMDKLSDGLSYKQKYNKVSSLLTKLRRRGVIVNRGSDTAPCWHLAESFQRDA